MKLEIQKVAVLRQFCGSFAAVLRQFCGSFAAVLRQFCTTHRVSIGHSLKALSNVCTHKTRSISRAAYADAFSYFGMQKDPADFRL